MDQWKTASESFLRARERRCTCIRVTNTNYHAYFIVGTCVILRARHGYTDAVFAPPVPAYCRLLASSTHCIINIIRTYAHADACTHAQCRVIVISLQLYASSIYKIICHEMSCKYKYSILMMFLHSSYYYGEPSLFTKLLLPCVKYY